MNIFKRIKFYYEYKKLVEDNIKELKEQYNIRIDNIYRLYTVIHVSDDVRSYGSEHVEALTEEWLKKWLIMFDTLLVNIHLKEFLIREELSKIDDHNYLLVMRYKYLNLEKIYYTLYLLGIIAFITIIVTIIIKLI